jgi:hypothetical protein
LDGNGRARMLDLEMGIKSRRHLLSNGAHTDTDFLFPKSRLPPGSYAFFFNLQPLPAGRRVKFEI